MDTTKPAPAQPDPKSSSASKIEITRDERLPEFWSAGPAEFMARIENLDPEYRFYWVKKSPHNQQLKRMQGWEPLEDPVRIAKYGFDPILVQANGRVLWMDTELWFMPKARNDAIRKTINDRLTRKSASVRATLDALAADTAGRSGGRVIPFVSTGTPGEDVFDRNQISESSARAGKAK